MTKSSRPTWRNSKPYKQWIENLRIKLDDVNSCRPQKRCGAP